MFERRVGWIFCLELLIEDPIWVESWERWNCPLDLLPVRHVDRAEWNDVVDDLLVERVDSSLQLNTIESPFDGSHQENESTNKDETNDSRNISSSSSSLEKKRTWVKSGRGKINPWRSMDEDGGERGEEEEVNCSIDSVNWVGRDVARRINSPGLIDDLCCCCRVWDVWRSFWSKISSSEGSRCRSVSVSWHSFNPRSSNSNHRRENEEEEKKKKKSESYVEWWREELEVFVRVFEAEWSLEELSFEEELIWRELMFDVEIEERHREGNNIDSSPIPRLSSSSSSSSNWFDRRIQRKDRDEKSLCRGNISPLGFVDRLWRIRRWAKQTDRRLKREKRQRTDLTQKKTKTLLNGIAGHIEIFVFQCLKRRSSSSWREEMNERTSTAICLNEARAKTVRCLSWREGRLK